MKKILLLTLFLLGSFSACTQEKIPKGTKSNSSMAKCGAGKCA